MTGRQDLLQADLLVVAHGLPTGWLARWQDWEGQRPARIFQEGRCMVKYGLRQ